MRLIVLDLETYFDDVYSLKRLTTEAYVLDPRFKAHMVGYFIPGEMTAPANCLPEQLAPGGFLHEPVQKSAVLCHHAHFDGLALAHHYGLKPAFWFDTLSMARLLLPRLRSHSLDALAQHFQLPQKNVPYQLFKGVQNLSDPTLDVCPCGGPPCQTPLGYGCGRKSLYQLVAEGCEHDVSLTYFIFRALAAEVPQEELRVIDATIRMFTEPSLRLDRPRLERFLHDEKLRKGRAMLDAGRALGIRLPTTVEEMKTFLMDVEAELQSSDKFKLALEAIGYPCPMKWSEKQEKDIPALAKNDDGMQELLEHDDSRVQTLAAARLGVKSTIDESRAERLLDADSRGALPVYLSYAAAKTLRFGGGDKSNWQNFRRGGEIRKSILAPEGHKLVIGDLSQIEYRLLCWLTGQTDKLEALAAGRDLYCEYASQFYGETVEKSDKPRRGVGKQGILMGGYGAGKGTMIRTAAGGGYGPKVFLSDEEGQRMVDLYRRGHQRVEWFWGWCGTALNYLGNGAELSYQVNGQTILEIADHKIWLPNDTALDYTGMRWARACDIFPDQKDDGEGPSWWEPTRKGWSRMWGSKLTADIVQSLARVVIVSALVKIAKRYKVVLQVHDEAVEVVPDHLVEEARAFVEETLKTPLEWCVGIQLEAEVTVSERYDK